MSLLRVEDVSTRCGGGISLHGCPDDALATRDRWSASRKASRLLAPDVSVPDSALLDIAATVSAFPIPLFALCNILFSAAEAAAVED